jgi:itaconyl-CoA hydratase
MNPILPAYKPIGERRFRETSGLYYEDFEPGDVFEHRPGRTVLEADNTWFTLLTMNASRCISTPPMRPKASGRGR